MDILTIIHLHFSNNFKQQKIMKKILLSMLALGMTISLSAQKMDFEKDSLGVPVGVKTGSKSTIEIVKNEYPKGNDSKKVMKVKLKEYEMLYFDSIPIVDGDRASYEFSKIRFKICVVGGTDKDYPQLDIFSAADFLDFSTAANRLVRLPFQQLWYGAEIGVWKTIEFSFSKSVLDPIPMGKLILQLVKGDCEYLIDDIEIVPYPEAVNGYLNIENFESNKIGDNFNFKAFYSTDYTDSVAVDPEFSTNKALHITTKNYGAFLKMNVNLEAGKTIADYDQISYDVYLMTGFNNNNMNFPVFINDTTVYTQTEPWSKNADDQLWTTIKHDLINLAPAKGANTFTLALGISSNNSNYYIDNIKLRQLGFTAIKETNAKNVNISSNNNQLKFSQTVDNVELFDVNGRKLLSSKNTSVMNITSLNKGIYIVKCKFDEQTTISKISK
jgi:hypothetical protein